MDNPYTLYMYTETSISKGRNKIAALAPRSVLIDIISKYHLGLFAHKDSVCEVRSQQLLGNCGRLRK